MSFDPTDEQMAAVGAFATGRSIAIEAGAGCGKSSTLRLCGEATNRTGRYLAFNKALVEDTRGSMPLNVDCSTAHSLAFRAVGKGFQHRLNGPRRPGWRTAKQLGIGMVVIKTEAEVKAIQPGTLAGYVMRGVARFCASADPEPTAAHFPWVEGIDWPDSTGKRTSANNRALAREMAPFMAKAWADVSDPRGTLPYAHGHYLKVYERGEPKVPGDFILFDECQDASAVLASVVEQQEGKQVVWVGDSAQAIYGWAGAIDIFERYPEMQRSRLTRSFRFGQAIADVANLVLDELESPMRLEGAPWLTSAVEAVAEPDAVLCRTNAGAVDAVLAYQKMGKRPFLVGGADEIVRFAKAADRLQEGEQVSHPELAMFSSWGQVLDYVSQDPQGDELRLMVRLVEDYGVDTIVAALDGMAPERSADVVISTAHKAKGREWPKVRLASDFPPLGAGADELRLLYVAATRAKETLDATRCAPMAELLSEAGVRLPAPPQGIPA